MDTVRTFISLNISETVKRNLARIQQEVMDSLSAYSIRWENPKKFHLTLRFLGDLNSSEIKDLVKELGKISLSFDTIVYFTDSIGFFPNAKYPNVIFIDLLEKGNCSAELVEKIDKVIADFDIKPDKKFVPHVTLGRFKRDHRQMLTSQVVVEVPKIEIVFEELYLMKSNLMQSSSEHEEIKSYKFKKLKRE